MSEFINIVFNIFMYPFEKLALRKRSLNKRIDINYKIKLKNENSIEDKNSILFFMKNYV